MLNHGQPWESPECLAICNPKSLSEGKEDEVIPGRHEASPMGYPEKRRVLEQAPQGSKSVTPGIRLLGTAIGNFEATAIDTTQRVALP